MLNSHLTKSRRRWKLHRRLKPKLTPSRRTIASCLHVGWNLEHFIARNLCLSCCRVLSTSFQQELIVIDPKWHWGFRKLWARARFLSTSFANNLLYWFGSWTSHAKTFLRKFPMPLRPLQNFGHSRSGCQSWLIALLSHDGAQQDAHLLQATWNVFYWSQLFFSQYAWGVIVYDDYYLCVCKISRFSADKCFAHFELLCCQCWLTWNGSLSILKNPSEFGSKVCQGCARDQSSIAIQLPEGD